MPRSKDDERAFREAVAKGDTPEEAAKRLGIKPGLVGLFTRRLPQRKRVEPPVDTRSPSDVLQRAYDATKRFGDSMPEPSSDTEE